MPSLDDLIAAAEKIHRRESDAAAKVTAEEPEMIAEAKRLGKPLHPDYWRRRHEHQSRAAAAQRMADALREIKL